ncbi:hypothetical protein F2P81_020562 [Scophthalmus maximus]|uniref:Uncharacterized protein n=1 Tax=Scophthalmus maximus TaxID=52904 RepID=A0A6A4S9Q1_SCOMX|nr:hypothetical protein F2P81_020562 [Scophthalmus maximus]
MRRFLLRETDTESCFSSIPSRKEGTLQKIGDFLQSSPTLLGSKAKKMMSLVSGRIEADSAASSSSSSSSSLRAKMNKRKLYRPEISSPMDLPAHPDETSAAAAVNLSQRRRTDLKLRPPPRCESLTWKENMSSLKVGERGKMKEEGSGLENRGERSRWSAVNHIKHGSSERKSFVERVQEAAEEEHSDSLEKRGTSHLKVKRVTTCQRLKSSVGVMSRSPLLRCLLKEPNVPAEHISECGCGKAESIAAAHVNAAPGGKRLQKCKWMYLQKKSSYHDAHAERRKRRLVARFAPDEFPSVSEKRARVFARHDLRHRLVQPSSHRVPDLFDL